MFCKANMPLNPHSQPLNFPKQMMSFAEDNSNLAIPWNGNEFLELGCTEMSRLCLYEEEQGKEGCCRTTKETSWEGSLARWILEVLAVKYQSTFGSTVKLFQPYTNKLDSLGNTWHRKSIGGYERKLVAEVIADLKTFFRGLLMNAPVPSKRKKTSRVKQAAHFAGEGFQDSWERATVCGRSSRGLVSFSAWNSAPFVFFFLKLLYTVPTPERKTVGEKLSRKELFLA